MGEVRSFGLPFFFVLDSVRGWAKTKAKKEGLPFGRPSLFMTGCITRLK